MAASSSNGCRARLRFHLHLDGRVSQCSNGLHGPETATADCKSALEVIQLGCRAGAICFARPAWAVQGRVRRMGKDRARVLAALTCRRQPRRAGAGRRQGGGWPRGTFRATLRLWARWDGNDVGLGAAARMRSHSDEHGQREPRDDLPGQRQLACGTKTLAGCVAEVARTGSLASGGGGTAWARGRETACG